MTHAMSRRSVLKTGLSIAALAGLPGVAAAAPKQGGVLNIGNYSVGREGAVNLGNAFLLFEDDVSELDYLASQGVDIQFQAIPDDQVKSWPTMKAKYESLK